MLIGILGSNSFIGNNLSRTLQQQGHEILIPLAS